MWMAKWIFLSPFLETWSLSNWKLFASGSTQITSLHKTLSLQSLNATVLVGNFQQVSESGLPHLLHHFALLHVWFWQIKCCGLGRKWCISISCVCNPSTKAHLNRFLNVCAWQTNQLFKWFSTHWCNSDNGDGFDCHDLSHHDGCYLFGRLSNTRQSSLVEPHGSSLLLLVRRVSCEKILCVKMWADQRHTSRTSRWNLKHKFFSFNGSKKRGSRRTCRRVAPTGMSVVLKCMIRTQLQEESSRLRRVECIPYAADTEPENDPSPSSFSYPAFNERSIQSAFWRHPKVYHTSAGHDTSKHLHMHATRTR